MNTLVTVTSKTHGANTLYSEMNLLFIIIQKPTQLIVQCWVLIVGTVATYRNHGRWMNFPLKNPSLPNCTTVAIWLKNKEEKCKQHLLEYPTIHYRFPTMHCSTTSCIPQFTAGQLPISHNSLQDNFLYYFLLLRLHDSDQLTVLILLQNYLKSAIIVTLKQGSNQPTKKSAETCGAIYHRKLPLQVNL